MYYMAVYSMTNSQVLSLMTTRSKLCAKSYQLSPTKRNKRDTMDYSTMILQTSTSTVEGLLYSSAKRPLLAESERSRTPIKIQKFTHTSDGCKVIVNDMTKISNPEQTEYSFQFTDVPTVPAAEMVSVKGAEQRR